MVPVVRPEAPGTLDGRKGGSEHRKG